MRPMVIFCWIAVLLAAIILTVTVQRGESYLSWSPDGYLYAQMMLADRGLSAEDSLQTARAFYAAKPFAATNSGAPLLSGNPPKFWRQQQLLYKDRVVYPYIASLLYPYFGFKALHLVSALAYVGAVAMMFLLLLRFATPLIASLGTVAFAGTEIFRGLSGSDSTDTLGMLLWISMLVVMIEFLERGKVAWLVVFAVLCVALSFTRPAIFLPLGAAVAVIVLGVLSHDRKKIAAGVLLTSTIGIVYLFASIAAHLPGPIAQISWLYQWQTEVHRWPITTLSAFYVYHVSNALAFEAKYLLGAGLVAIPAIAATAFYLNRRDPATAILVGGCAAACLAIFLDPMTSDLNRVFEMPTFPAITVGIVIAVRRLLEPPNILSS